MRLNLQDKSVPFRDGQRTEQGGAVFQWAPRRPGLLGPEPKPKLSIIAGGDGDIADDVAARTRQRDVIGAGRWGRSTAASWRQGFDHDIPCHGVPGQMLCEAETTTIIILPKESFFRAWEKTVLT